MKPIYLDKVLGIDIREESVALAYLGKQFKGIDVLGYDHFHIKPLDPADERTEKAFLDGINKFLMQYNAYTPTVVISLPRNLVSFQTFPLPAPDLNVIDSMVEFELERHFFSKAEDLYFSYHAIAEYENNFQVTLCSLRKEIVNYYLELMEKLSIKPTALDVSTFSHLNLVWQSEKNAGSLFCVVDIDSQRMEICLAKNGMMIATRSIPINDSNIKKGFFMEEIPPQHLNALGKKFSKTVLSEIMTTLASCTKIDSDEEVDQIFVTGGGPFLQSLMHEIQEEAQVSTRCLEFFSNGNGANSAQFNPAFYSTAFGLACREIRSPVAELNLLPPEIRPKKKKVNYKITVGLVIVVFVALLAALGSEYYSKVRALATLNKQLKEVQTQAAPFEQIDIEFDDLNQYAEIITRLEKRLPSKLPILQELSRIIPEGTYLSDINVDEDVLQIKGYSKAASGLIQILENSPLLKDTSFKGSIVKSNRGEKFTIQSTLEGIPPS